MAVADRLADPEGFDADPDPTFHADADPEPHIFSWRERTNFFRILNCSICFQILQNLSCVCNVLCNNDQIDKNTDISYDFGEG